MNLLDATANATHHHQQLAAGNHISYCHWQALDIAAGTLAGSQAHQVQTENCDCRPGEDLLLQCAELYESTLIAPSHCPKGLLFWMLPTLHRFHAEGCLPVHCGLQYLWSTVTSLSSICQHSRLAGHGCKHCKSSSWERAFTLAVSNGLAMARQSHIRALSS